MILLVRFLWAALSGAVTFFSYAPAGVWPAGFVGIAGLYAVLTPWGGRHLRWWQGALLAACHSFVLYLLLLPWIGELVGAFPYIALAVSMSLYALLTGIGGVMIGRWRYGFVAFPLFYVAIEMLRSSVPFGGFSWIRLAWGQIEGPLAWLAPWGGPALITAATAFIGCGLVGLYKRGSGPKIAGAILVAAPLGFAVLAGQGVNNPQHETGSVKAAAVQGNVPRMGLDFAAQRMAVLNNHVKVSHQLARDHEDLDFAIWPENSSDVNPFRNPDARRSIEGAVDAIGAPVLVGTLTYDEVGARNTMQVFNPGGKVGDHHFKKYLQPFGETMPMREFFSHFSPYVERAGDFKAGDGPGTVRMGDAVVGVATCYEVAFDNAFRSSIANGAQILATPTNNATFGYSNMTFQQLAMSRLRALETDRAVIVAATSGVSAIVLPDGTVSQQTGIFEPKYLVERLPLKDSVTFAVRHGNTVQWVLVIAGVILALLALAKNRLPRRELQAEQPKPVGNG